jgi:hypothetical protein
VTLLAPSRVSEYRTPRVTPGAFDSRGPVLRGHTVSKKKYSSLLVTKSKSTRQKMNVSFDGSLLDDDENLPPASGLNSNSNVVIEQRAVLGSLVKDKSKEHLLDGILRQAYREGLLMTLGFPKRTEWIKKNIPVWFSSGGLLAQ